jgi:hypothetical protein
VAGTNRLSLGAACVVPLLSALALTAKGDAPPVIRDHILPRSESFFGLHFDLHPGATDTELYADCSEGNIRALLTRVNPDYVQWDCKGHPGYTGYPTAVGWSSPGIAVDSLAVLRKVTREFHAGLYIHYSGVWDSVACEHHPEWGAVNADGTRDPNSTSTFGPYVDELLIPQLREVIGKYDLDGVWADGECWATKLDWCDTAVARFREETGLAEAPKKRGDPGWDEWKALHRKQFEAYVSHWVDAVHAFRPEAQLASNWMYTTFAPKPVVAGVDFLSGDYSPTLSVDRGRTEARYLASTGMPWDLMAWGFNWVDGTGHCLKTPEHLEQEAGVVLMQGGGFQIYNLPTRRGWIAPALIETLGQVADFCRARQSLCQGSTTVPQVAVLYSLTSQLDRSDAVFTPYGCQQEIDGTVQALVELGYSVDLLAEHRLEPVLDQYPLVVLPDCHKLTEAFRQALVAYVERGGSLLCLGAQSASLLLGELGVEFVGDPVDGAPELEVGDLFVSCAGPWQPVTPTSARTLARRFATRRMDGPDGLPAATIVTRGAGQIAAIYGPLAATFERNHHPYLRRLLGSVTRELFPRPMVELDGPPCVDLSLRRTRDGRLTVHLLNTNGLPAGPYTVTDSIVPVHDLGLTLRLPARPTRLTLEPSGTTLEWTWEAAADGGGLVHARVPKVALYEIVVVE